MKYFTYIILFLLSNICNSASMKEAIFIYKQILVSNHFTSYPGMIKDPSKEFNASVGIELININQGMLRRVKNKHELAFIIGHELAHWKHGYSFGKWIGELNADKSSLYYIRKAGYNSCLGAKILLRFNRHHSESHPAGTYRYKLLGCK